jgi:diguanylate cyclase (GGDEF)-like protein
VLALTIFDIDRFKSVNDAYGHLVGDAAIRAVGRMMQEELGALGLIARVGGEEFALLTSRASLEDMVEGLLAFRDRLRATPILIGDVTLRVTVSAGVALRENGDGFDRLYGLADRALYEAKAAGRNQFRFPPSLEPLVNRFATRFQPASRVTTLRSA